MGGLLKEAKTDQCFLLLLLLLLGLKAARSSSVHAYLKYIPHRTYF